MAKGEILHPKTTKYFEWQVHFQTEEEYGISCKSPKFRFFKTSWSLEYVPEKNEESFSMYLVKDHSQIPQHRITVQIGRTGQFGDILLSVLDLQEFTDQALSCLIGSKISMAGIRDRYSSEKSQIVRFFCLLKSCYPESVKADTQNLETEGENRLVQNFRDLLHSHEETDIILRVQGRDFRSHRAILAARSTVFAAMLKHDMKEQVSGVVVIEDCDPEVFESFLEYLYTGSVEFSGDTAIRLYKIADKYESPDLKVKCVDFISRRISVDKFFEVTKLSLEYKESELLEKATDFFMKNFRKISHSSRWQTFVEEYRSDAKKMYVKGLGYY